MPLCGFNDKMIHGIATFSEGLYEATIERGREKGVDAVTAVRDEIKEIDLFLNALRTKYGKTVETPKKMAEMVYGIAVFSSGLFRASITSNTINEPRFKRSFDEHVKEISEFLEKLETTHKQLKTLHSPKQTMFEAVEWIDVNDVTEA